MIAQDLKPAPKPCELCMMSEQGSAAPEASSAPDAFHGQKLDGALRGCDMACGLVATLLEDIFEEGTSKQVREAAKSCVSHVLL